MSKVRQIIAKSFAYFEVKFIGIKMNRCIDVQKQCGNEGKYDIWNISFVETL